VLGVAIVWSVPSLILILVGAGFFGFGAAYALRPARMAALTDLTLTSPTARVDFVATYGGFQIGFGIFLLGCAREITWQVPGLWAAVAALGGFASFRALAMLLHRGRVRGSLWFALGLELCGVALSLWALTRAGPIRQFAGSGAVPDEIIACHVNRPHVAEQTLDGRVGAVLLRNASPSAAESCVTTLGGAAAWTPGEFRLRWDRDRLRPEERQEKTRRR
jgi:hypothetical protein